MMSAWVLWALPPELCSYTVERGPVVATSTSRDDQAIAVRWSHGDQRDICKSSPDEFSFIHAARSPCDHPPMIERRSTNLRQVDGKFFPLNFGWLPTGSLLRAGRHPTGCRWMSEWPQTSADHPPNFNCELNLPGRRWTSARWGLCHGITAGFFRIWCKNRRTVAVRLISLYWDVSFTRIMSHLGSPFLSFA